MKKNILHRYNLFKVERNSFYFIINMYIKDYSKSNSKACLFKKLYSKLAALSLLLSNLLFTLKKVRQHDL